MRILCFHRRRPPIPKEAVVSRLVSRKKIIATTMWRVREIVVKFRKRSIKICKLRANFSKR